MPVQKMNPRNCGPNPFEGVGWGVFSFPRRNRPIMLDRRTKIVCTLGPAVASEEGILRLVQDGMDVARLNMSHGEHADHEANYNWVRQATDKTGRAVGILASLARPL